MTIQQTIIACTVAIIAAIYAISDAAFWKPKEPWEVWCEANGKPWIFDDTICKGSYAIHRFESSQF